MDNFDCFRSLQSVLFATLNRITKMAISLCLKLRHISLLIASTAIRMPKRILRTQHERMTMAVDLFENNRSQLYSQPVLECKEYKLGHGLIFYWVFFTVTIDFQITGLPTALKNTCQPLAGCCKLLHWYFSLGYL